MRIQPAEVAFDDAGVPLSPAFGDVYHSADSGPGQARHVFIGGNDLPRRWADARVFAIVETGFGLGLNFLETWRAWRDDSRACARLHYVSIEKHPLDRERLERVHRAYPELAALSAALRDAWPPLTPGLHRLHFEGGAVTLTLAFGDATTMVPRLRLAADAIYLDGFAPARNPDMWSPRLLKGLARLARPGTTVATWSTAAAVRDGLEAAGFKLEKRSGFGRKREMLAGTYAPRGPLRRSPVAPARDRHAMVIGAGLAGAAVTERLAARGWRIDLVDAQAAPDTQQRFAGVFHPHVSPDDCLRSRAARSGFLYGVSRWLELERGGHALAWDRCGVLQIAGEHEDENRMRQTIESLGLPAAYAEYVARDEAQRLAGARLRGGGWWFSGGGWMRAATLIAAQLAAARARGAVTSQFGRCVQSIVPSGESWTALDADGVAIATAPVVVLASSSDVARFASFGAPLARVRGQVSYVPSHAVAAPRTVITGRGYVMPASEGFVVAGSTYDNEDDPAPSTHAHEANLMHLRRLLPHALETIDAKSLQGAVGFRCAAPDRMPLVGAVPDVEAARRMQPALAGAQLRDVPRVPGIYCATAYASRGLVWSALAGEAIASVLEGEPLPLESDLADALDPARFVLRQVRRGRL